MSNASSDEGAASTAAETQPQTQTQTPAPAQAEQHQPRSREGGQQREDRPRVDRRHPDDYDRLRPRRSYDDDYDRPRRNSQPQGSQVHGLVWALLGVVLILGLVWLIGRFAPETPIVQQPQAQLVNPQPQPQVVNPVPPAEAPAMSQGEVDALFNRTPGTGPAMQPTGTVMNVVSLDFVQDQTYGPIYVPNKASGQAITADSPNSPPPAFQLHCPDPTGGKIEAFVTNERARSGRYFVMFRARP